MATSISFFHNQIQQILEFSPFIRNFGLEVSIHELQNTFEQQLMQKHPKIPKSIARIKFLQLLNFMPDVNTDIKYEAQNAAVTPAEITQFLQKFHEYNSENLKLRNEFKLNLVKIAIQNELTDLVVTEPRYHKFADYAFHCIVSGGVLDTAELFPKLPENVIAFKKGSTQMREHLFELLHNEESFSSVYKKSDIDTCIMLHPDFEDYQSALDELVKNLWLQCLKFTEEHDNKFREIFDGVQGALSNGEHVCTTLSNDFVIREHELLHIQKQKHSRSYKLDVSIAETGQNFTIIRIKIPFCFENHHAKRMYGEFLDIVVMHRSSQKYQEAAKYYFGLK